MNLAIIKYNAGNIRSVHFALERLGISARITDDERELRLADKVIFPGVGEASSAMQYLRERGLDKVIISLHQPVLGICLGMQLMCKYSEENDTACLGIFDQQVKKFNAFPPMQEGMLKVPQIGWNNIFQLSSPLFAGIGENSFVYFVHSYYVEQGAHTIATANYGVTYSAGIRKDNFYAVQFHPEKSAEVGQKILENFLKL